VNAIGDPAGTTDGLARSRQAAGTETRKFHLAQDEADIERRIGHGNGLSRWDPSSRTVDDAGLSAKKS
jgi:hypothetical protein